jgi:hypothetical protein
MASVASAINPIAGKRSVFPRIALLFLEETTGRL